MIEWVSTGLGSFTGSPLAVPLLLAKVTLILAAALGVTRTMRRMAASARHAVWLVSLTAVLLVPAVSAWMPLPLPAEVRAAGRVWPWPTMPVDGPERVSAPGKQLAIAAADPASEQPVSPRSMPYLPEALRTVSGGSLFVGIWAVVVLGIVGSILRASLAVRSIIGRARPLDTEPWLAPLREVSDRLGLREPPRLLCSDEVRMPFACGVLRPTVVLPSESARWTVERCRAVLLHELAHVRRRDLPAHLISRIACAVYWFHPLVWAAAARLRAESERACDDVAIVCGVPAPEYAEHLLALVAAGRRDSTPRVALAMARRKELEGRILAILDVALHRTPTRSWRAAILLGSLALTSLGIGAAVPSPRQVRASVHPPTHPDIDVALERSVSIEVRVETTGPRADF